MPDVLVDHDTETDVLVEREVDVVLEQSEPEEIIITEAGQGPPGPQGIPGPAGGATLVTVGATPLSGHIVVALDSGGLLVYADCTNLAHIGAVQGVIANAYSPGDLAVVQADFGLVHAGWSFSPGPVFVGASGALVQMLPVGAVFAQVIGYALAPTLVRIDVQPPIVLT